MSAEIIDLPQPIMHPDAEHCLPLVEACGGDEGRLFSLALLSLVTIEGRRNTGNIAYPECRDLVNRLFIAWLALGEILGLTADKIEEALRN